MPFNELTVGQVMRFDVVFNKTSGKNIAKNVAAARNSNFSNSTIGDFQSMQTAKFTSVAVEPVATINKLNVEGTIVEVSENHGFIDCDHELIFFHYNQLCGTIMSELKPGMTVKFDKMFNNVSQRLVAHSVKIVSTGHFIDSHQTAAAVQTAHKGKISKINSDHGFIDAEDGSNMFFHYSQILSTVLNQLQIDQPVTFTRVFNETSKKFIAHNVAPRTAPESAALSLVKDTLRIEANNLIRRLSGVVMNDISVGSENVEIVNVLGVPSPARKDSSVSDLFLTPKSDRSSRRGSIVSFNRKL